MGKNSKEYYHDKGEKDRAEGRYKPPHDILDDFLTWSDSGMKKINEDNEAYNKGWRNTDKQKKGNSGK
ncbi:hypothetical protein C8N46_109148 [Kordia periserrulae]|uniref:Uncharacterized protein n=1 Tax=Kordia periserrulae TaxID=701523 RepID=A0A2T6BU20_9FLAO|nr:hypothetical protein [Kordia periserrulae]PTX59559.1 hypothetical protein C8N46_109148 [Kordia periserrulae]